MIKILFVFGTRPEAIKMAPLIHEFARHKDRFKSLVCVTGQHREMLDQVMRIFKIRPDFDLDIMRKGQDLFDVTTGVLSGLKGILEQVRPDCVLVHGDTTTSVSAAIAAFYFKIPVGHVEAGLRTHNLLSPYPEEFNRQVTSRIAAYHFAPTLVNKKNLLDEGIKESSITVTGNTVIDALQLATRIIQSSESELNKIVEHFSALGISTEEYSKERKMVLITGHRRENFGDGFLNICHAINELATKYPAVDFVYPVHLNPNVRKPVSEILSQEKHHNVHLIEPQDYLPFVHLLERSYLVVTDSGGVQEEAPGLGKPVLVMRDTTERPEAVEAGTVKLVGADQIKIVNNVSLLLEDESIYNDMTQASNPYGDGSASVRIVQALKKNFV